MKKERYEGGFGASASDVRHGHIHIDGQLPPERTASEFGETLNPERFDHNPVRGMYDPYGHGGFVRRDSVSKER